MTKNVRKSTLSVLIAFVLLVATVSTAFAAPPLDVQIVIHEYIGTDGEPFLVSGPASDAEVVCATGVVNDTLLGSSGPPGGSFTILNVQKHFVCADGSGTFDIRLVVRLDLITNETTARWHVVGGTGDYTDLHGSGSLIGIPQDPGVSILDIYDGKMH